MRHVLVVGYEYGTVIGRAIEAAQWFGPWFGQNTRGSSFNSQDYYSNNIGYNMQYWYLNRDFQKEFRNDYPDFSHAFEHFILYHNYNCD